MIVLGDRSATRRTTVTFSLSYSSKAFHYTIKSSKHPDLQTLILKKDKVYKLAGLIDKEEPILYPGMP